MREHGAPEFTLDPSEIHRIDAYRRSKHTAVLTVLFTDIVGSTGAAEKLGEAQYLKLKYLHDDLIRPVIERDGGGMVIKEIGDSFMAVFAEPSTAVERAVEIQTELAANRDRLFYGGYHLRVRSGLHMGQVSVENRLTPDIFGRHVNRAARIMSIAQPGQVLTSQAVWDNASGWLADHDAESIRWKKLGTAPLKGFDGKFALYEFYNRELGSAGVPEQIQSSRRNRWALYVLAAAVLAIGGYFLVRAAMKPATDATPPDRDVYYFQGDYSKLADYAGDTKSTYVVGPARAQVMHLDTLSLHNDILSQVLSVIYPDSVVTDSELSEKAMRSSDLYRRRPIEETEFYRDTLGLSGVLQAQVLFDSTGSPVLYFSCRPFGPTNAGFVHALDEPGLLKSLREFLVNFWIKYRQPRVLMKVIGVQDSTLLLSIRSPADFRVQPGLSLRINRSFRMDQQREEYLAYLDQKMQYFERVDPDSATYLEVAAEHAFILNHEDTTVIPKGNVFVTGDLIGTARLVEVYDSTGRAEIVRHVAWSKPAAGDAMNFE